MTGYTPMTENDPVYPMPQKTNLTPQQELKFIDFKNKLPESLRHEGDYDLRRLFLENPNLKPSLNMHFPDKYKLPNHPTFSNESMYFNPTNQYLAGKWVETPDEWQYVPYNEKYKSKIIEKKVNNAGL